MKKFAFALLAVCACFFVLACSESLESGPQTTLAGTDANYLLDSRDGRSYKIVQIGDQTWMAENLNFYAEDSGMGLVQSSYCYDNDSLNCEKYGRLYKKKVTADICPAGWHLPSKEEFLEMLENVGGRVGAGLKLKSREVWPDSGKGVDSFGMNVLPAGYYFLDGFYYFGSYTYFWTTSDVRECCHYAANLVVDRDYVFFDEVYDEFGLSVRCVKD